MNMQVAQFTRVVNLSLRLCLLTKVLLLKEIFFALEKYSIVLPKAAI